MNELLVYVVNSFNIFKCTCVKMKKLKRLLSKIREFISMLSKCNHISAGFQFEHNVLGGNFNSSRKSIRKTSF